MGDPQSAPGVTPPAPPLRTTAGLAPILTRFAAAAAAAALARAISAAFALALLSLE